MFNRTFMTFDHLDLPMLTMLTRRVLGTATTEWRCAADTGLQTVYRTALVAARRSEAMDSIRDVQLADAVRRCGLLARREFLGPDCGINTRQRGHVAGMSGLTNSDPPQV